MRGLLFAGAAMLLVVSTAVSAAQPEGPRAASENNWPGMSNPTVAPQAAVPAGPHYVWREGYEHGGKWHGHWILVQ